MAEGLKTLRGYKINIENVGEELPYSRFNVCGNVSKYEANPKEIDQGGGWWVGENNSEYVFFSEKKQWGLWRTQRGQWYNGGPLKYSEYVLHVTSSISKDEAVRELYEIIEKNNNLWISREKVVC